MADNGFGKLSMQLTTDLQEAGAAVTESGAARRQQRRPAGR